MKKVFTFIVPIIPTTLSMSDVSIAARITRLYRIITINTVTLRLKYSDIETNAHIIWIAISTIA